MGAGKAKNGQSVGTAAAAVGMLLLGLGGAGAALAGSRAAGAVTDGHHVDDLGLGDCLDLLDGDAVRGDHENDGVVGRLEEGRNEAGVAGNLAPLAERLLLLLLPAARRGPVAAAVAGPR